MDSIPKKAWLTVNRSCNFRCKWCYAKSTEFDHEQTLTMDLALRLLNIIQKLEIKHITLIGGEPTLWKHLMDFNTRSREMGMKTSLVTNAYRFADDDFWNQYRNNPNDIISVSLKAFDSKSAKELARINDFETMKTGLKRAISEFKSGVLFVCNSFVSNDLVSLAKIARDCGAENLIISPCTPSFSKEGVETVGMLELGELVKSVVSQYDEIDTLFDGKLTFAIKTPLCVWPRDFVEVLTERKQMQATCQFQHRSGIIFDPKGKALSCNSLADFPIGTIDKDYDDAESLIKMFNSENVINTYNYVNSYPSELCINCSKNKICRGGCPLMWAVYNPRTCIPGW